VLVDGLRSGPLNEWGTSPRQPSPDQLLAVGHLLAGDAHEGCLLKPDAVLGFRVGLAPAVEVVGSRFSCRPR
jgi:hypothetical protein